MKKRMKYLLMLITFVLVLAGCNKSGKADETTAANTEDELKTVKDLGDSSFRKYLDGLKSDEVDESERIDAYQLTSGNVKLSDEETREYTYTAQASVTTAAGGDTISVTYQIRKISDGAFETVSMDFERGNAGADPAAPSDSDGSSGSQAGETTESPTVRITIPEGYTVAQIFNKLEEKGVCSAKSLFEVCNSFDYSYYSLVAEIPENEHRCFRLEGYLFPDTYDFYRDSKPEDAIGVFLRNAEKKISDEIRSAAADKGLSVYELLTVASMIEKEGANPDEMPNISSIIYNRLDAGMKLELDATITYVEKHIKPYIDGDQDRYSAYYNTYRCDALPSGPISNPGMKAIQAALNPADTDYYYFVNDDSANYYYAETYEEHLKNVEKAGQ